MTRCLIIEDDAEARRASADVLTRAGLEVRGSNHTLLEASGPGLQWAELILLDMSPPYQDRPDLLQRALGTTGERCVIVTSNIRALDDCLEAIRLGAIDFLPKPVREADLGRSVDRAQRLIARRREMARFSEVARRRVEDLSMLNRICGLIISADPDEQCMRSSIDATREYLGAQAAAVLLLDEAGQALEPLGLCPAGEARDRVTLTPAAGGIAWACLEGARPIKVDELEAEGPQAEALGVLLGCQVRCLLAVPVIVEEQPIGVFLLANRIDGGRFEDADLERLAELARHLSAAVHKATSVRELKRSRDELERMSAELGQVVEERTRALRQLRDANRRVRKDMDRTFEEAQGMRRALAENERMAILGLLAAGVSHEINNPLGFVSNNLGVLRDYVRSMFRLAAVVAHASSRLEAGRDEVVIALAKEAIKVLRDENIPAVMNDIGPLFDETQQGLSRIEVIVDKLHRLAEGSLSDGAPVQIDLVAELQRLAELVQGSGASPLTIRFEDEGRPVVKVPQMSLRLLLLSLLGHFTRRRRAHNQIAIATGSEGAFVRLELTVEDAKVPAEKLRRMLCLEPADGTGETPGQGPSLGIAVELAHEMGGQLTGSVQAAQGYRLRLLLPDASAQASISVAGGG